MVHGLMASDAKWQFKDQPGVTYGSRLAADRDVTPVYVTYNSGRHISANGRQLAAMLDDLVAGWPVPVTEIDLIGHSMGGLVVRSACHYGVAERRVWAGLARRLFLLGAPNRGATFEQIAYTITVRACRRCRWARCRRWAGWSTAAAPASRTSATAPCSTRIGAWAAAIPPGCQRAPRSSWPVPTWSGREAIRWPRCSAT